MNIIRCAIPDLLIMEPAVYRDERGSFMETYNQKLLAESGFNEVFVQDNESVSRKGVIRALHFQVPPMAQGKLVRVVGGSVMDIAVDIRTGSPWYMQYEKVLLSAENGRMFWLPPGFAHGFIALEDNTVFSYKCTNLYSKEHEGAIRWNDPDINIEWGTGSPVVSQRDAEAPLFSDYKGEFVYGKNC